MQKSLSVGLTLALAVSLLTSLVAWADSNSVFLINATNGPIDTYRGTGIRIGEIDVPPGVVDSNHLFLLNQIIGTTNLVAGTSGSLDSHATQVAGVLVSTDSVVRGVAPGANVYSVESPLASAPSAAFFLATQQNVRVINASIGNESVSSNETFGFIFRNFNTLGTSVVTRALDRLVSETRVTYVNAAGNQADRRAVAAASEGGTNTVVEEAGAFNIIVVGAVNNAVAGTATNVSFFSSRGYLADGRSAVSIVAPGEGVIMPTTPIGPNKDRVATNDGTSFAAPHVAGVAARLIQYGNTLVISDEATDPRTVKAVLLNSATKLPGWGQGAVFGGTPGLQGTLTGGVTQVKQPLDPNQGAGLLNAGAAFAQLSAGKKSPTVQQLGLISVLNPSVTLTGWDFNSVNLSLTNFYQLAEQSLGTLSITLDWYRDVGPTVAGTNSVLGLANLTLNLYTSPSLQSPMDLAAGGVTNLTLVAQSISAVDNLQHLWFTNAPAAYYVFAVVYNGYNSAGGSTPNSIDYGLAWSFAPIPEPSTLLLAALGLTVVCRLRRRRTRDG